MDAVPLAGNDLNKAELGYHGKFVHTIGMIQHIYLMSWIEICYTNCHLSTQTVAPTLPGFQGIKYFIKYLAIDPHKSIFNPYNYNDGSNVHQTNMDW